jgi:hypothetical protein
MPDAVIHPTPQELSAFGLGKLPEHAAAVVAAHLESCSTCLQAVAGVMPDSFLNKVRAAGPAGTDNLLFRLDRLFVLLTPLAAPALTRESHDGPPDPVCLTGCGQNHRRVQRSSANRQRSSRPQRAERGRQRAETATPEHEFEQNDG